jgi:outer membrane PBP1 activator LpoA protein
MRHTVFLKGQPGIAGRRATSIAVAALAGLLLMSGAGAADTDAQRAAAAQQRGDFAQASQAWESAAQHTPAAAAEFLLSAAETALWAGDDRRAETLLTQVPRASLDAPQSLRVQMLRAEIALHRNLAYGALQSLPESTPLTRLAPRLYRLRSEAYLGLGDPVSAAQALVLRERALGEDSNAIRDNRDLLWRLLAAYPVPASLRQEATLAEPLTRAWLEAAEVQRSGDPQAVTAWLQRYPGHPAASRLSRVVGTQASAGAAADSPALAGSVPATPAGTPAFGAVGGEGAIALLLPLGGSYAGAAAALRDGFSEQYLAAGAAQPPMRIYDSGLGPADAIAAYQQALRDGAGIIVGPLQKEAVAALAAQGAPTVPVLALNYLDRGAAAPRGLLQFGLAPEDEARAAALQAAADGRLRAVALVPRSEWGQRVLAAFQSAYAGAGGQLLSSETFASGEINYAPAVSRLINVSQSEDRHRALTAILGESSEFQPRRRNDIDTLFVAARPAELTLIEPQLRFYHATHLAAYSVAIAYEANSPAPLDMKVCDMPWTLEAAGSWQAAQQQASRRFPDELQQYPRLFAMGGDAYRIVGALRDGRLGAGAALPGATGQLDLAPDGRIVRGLGCAAIRDGKLISPGAAAGTPEPGHQ